MIGRYIAFGLIALVGLIFIGQGLGYIGGSGMTGQPFWAAVGAVMVVVAALFAWRTSRANRS